MRSPSIVYRQNNMSKSWLDKRQSAIFLVNHDMVVNALDAPQFGKQNFNV